MLNELRELALCLEKTGIDIEDLHPNFKSCPKYLTYWIYLDEQGDVAGVTPVPSEQVQKYRKWEKANGVSFPAFNMPPIFKAASIEAQEQIKGLKKCIDKGVAVSAEEIKSVVNACEALWEEEVANKKGINKQPFIEKLTDCVTKPIADFSDLLNDAPDNCKAITQLISRTKQVKATTFKEQLACVLQQKIIDEPNTNLIDVLFYYSGKTPTNFQIILELDGQNLFEYPANHQVVQRWMNQQFLGATGQASRSDLDAFGCNATGRDGKFPPVGFKNALGNVILRAMNQESPCQTRYGMIDFHSFPAGDEARKGMKGALEWLGSEERKGKTWCDLSRRMEKSMLLFAYPSIMPEDLPDLAGMMGDVEDDDSEANDERFAALSEKVTAALRGGTKETIDCEIRVFVLAKMDKARTKVLTSNRFSADHVIQSAQNWQDGCHNLPPIEVRSFGKKKGDKAVWSKPLVPFPIEVVWCLNTAWMRQGSHAEGVHGFSVNDALCLLLGESFELRQTAARALGTLVRNSSTLLLALGQAQVLGQVLKTDKKYSKQSLLLPSILGLLLHKLGNMKGEIMTSPAFLVGRFLNLADSLHLEYCKGVRKGSVPPQLVGNALMATALEAPERALSMLSQRVLPYQAWARTVKEGDRIGLVKTFLKQLGEVSEQLKDATLPQRSSDADKAQMLLGYLARNESEKN
jgi:predicted nucleic-acid-binding protein